MTAADVLADVRALTDVPLPDDVDGLAATWRDVREAANLLYALCKKIEPALLTADPNSRGWHNGGRPVQVNRRFEVELLDESQFVAWLADLPEADRKDAEVEWVPRLNKTARELVKSVVVGTGEKPAGVSAGYGSPFLAVGR